MKSLDAIPALLAVLEEGSIQGAAAKLGISRPTVRKRLESLEAEVGAPLLFRSDRGYQATESGRVYATRARQMLQDLDVLARAARLAGPTPGGLLRVGLPTGTPAPILANMVSVLRATWPSLQLEVITSSLRRDDLLREVDCLFCLDLAEPEGPFEVLDLGSVDEMLVTSADYLEAHPIRSVADLNGHPILAWIAPDDRRPSPLPVEVAADHLAFSLCSDDASALLWMAARGHGLAWVPYDPALAGPPFIDVGPLVPVLPDLVRRERKRRLLVAESVAQLPTVRSFLEATREAIKRFGSLR